VNAMSLGTTYAADSGIHRAKLARAPFFSVVIPAYNAERYIAETLNSVQCQSFAEFEVIVVDDGSTDSTLEIVEHYSAVDDRFRVLRLPQRSGGPATPRNIGIAASRGEYIALLDSDDIWGPDKLQHDSDFLTSQSADILYSGCYYFDESPKKVVHRVAPRQLTTKFFLKNHISTLTLCLRRSMCTGRQVFDPDPLLGIEDYHFLLNAYLAGRTICSRPGIDAYHRRYNVCSYYDPDNFPKVFRRHIYNIAKLGAIWSIKPSRLIALIVATACVHSARHLRDQICEVLHLNGVMRSQQQCGAPKGD
jgi:teichuronic acid biosynthesis glycosyltransferase TuaG